MKIPNQVIVAGRQALPKAGLFQYFFFFFQDSVFLFTRSTFLFRASGTPAVVSSLLLP